MLSQQYSEDLAHVHEASANHALASAPGILSILVDNQITQGQIIDLGCGSGHLVKILTGSGYEATGVDVSSELIKIAQQRIPEAQFEVNSYLNFQLPKCQAIIASGEVFNYQLDPEYNLNQLSLFFQRAFQALRAGGVMIFDISEPGRYPHPKKIWFHGQDWYCLAELKEDPETHIITRDITTFRHLTQNQTYRKTREVHTLQVYPRDTMINILKTIGFEVTIVKGYGSYKFPPEWNAYTGYIAQKPSQKT